MVGEGYTEVLYYSSDVYIRYPQASLWLITLMTCVHIAASIEYNRKYMVSHWCKAQHMYKGSGVTCTHTCIYMYMYTSTVM